MTMISGSAAEAGARARTPRDIALDATLSNARKIELLSMIKHHNAAPWQVELSREADVEMSRLLRR